MTRILVVGPSWVGDMVMAQSLFMLLRQHHPDCRISVLAPAWSEPVTARMPEVADSIAMPVGHGRVGLGERRRLGQSLRGRFDRAIVLPGSFKSALVPWFARIPVRTGFTGEQRFGLLNDRRRLDKERMPYHLQRVAALAFPPDQAVAGLDDLPWPSLQIDSLGRQDVAARFGLAADRPIIALCPGAEFGTAKQWPLDYYGQVAATQIGNGMQVAVFGSAKDNAAASSICAATPGVIDLTGKTTLGEAIDLMSLARGVVTNDSGLMHIAAAVGVPLIALYGSSSDAYTPPLHPAARRLSRELDCRPCFQRTCPLGHLDCLRGIPAQEVNDILTELLAMNLRSGAGNATAEDRPGP